MRSKSIFFVLSLLLVLFFAACSEDDDSNPSNPQTPESAGTYEGTNHMDTTMSVTISGISGVPYVTSYNLAYKVTSGGTSVKGNYGRTDSDGISEVTNNSFEVSLGTYNGDYLRGTVNGNQMTGSYKFLPLFADTVQGTFSISK